MLDGNESRNGLGAAGHMGRLEEHSKQYLPVYMAIIRFITKKPVSLD
jgi:hypothetical protein